MGEVIAARRLVMVDDVGSEKAIEVRLGKPVEAGEAYGYYCPFEVRGFGSGNAKSVRGDDSVNALQNALAALNAEMCIIGCNFELRREGHLGASTGFLDMPLLRATWKSWFVDADYSKAVSLAIPLAKGGVAFAQKILGIAKFVGWGSPVDIPGAVLWLASAAEQGEPDACDLLAGIYLNGCPDVPVNLELAKRYQEMAHYYGFQGNGPSVPNEDGQRTGDGGNEGNQ